MKANQIWMYPLLVIVCSVLPYTFILAEGDVGSGWFLLLMWMPAIAAVAMRIMNKEGVFKGLGWNPLKQLHWILLGALLPLAIEWGTIALTIGLGFAEYNAQYISMADGLVSLKGNALLFGTGPQSVPFFAMNYLLSYFAGAFFYMLFLAIGEEYGWRGYWQAHLSKKFGYEKALLILGIFWGLWHAPGVLMGHNYPEYPILGSFLLMPLVTVLFSVIFGNAYRYSGVIWVPAMFHAGNNIAGEIGKIAMTSINTIAYDAIWTLLLGMVALVFYFAGKKSGLR